VNPATLTLIERPYLEVVDDILTAMTGGVVKEPIFFDVKELLYSLSRPARDIRSITGTRDRQRFTFQKEVDYHFSIGDNAVVWEPGRGPDDETTFYVNYFVPDTLSPLTDINVGSVTRTLSEAVGREIATVFQEINAAYLAGFIDTASGTSLDLVVSILHVERKTKDYAIGLVTFFRDPAAGDGNITIPPGTRVSTSKGEASFVAVDLRTLQRGQSRIDVMVRADEASKGPKGVVEAGTITTLAQPITGIARITNLDKTFLGADDETDDALRARAKAALQGLNKATLAALVRVVFEARANLVEVWDPNGPPNRLSEPGRVALLVQATPDRFTMVQAGVNETRAAGVRSTVVAKYVYFKPRIVLTIASALTAAGKVKLVGQVIEAIQTYANGLAAGTPAAGADLIKAIANTAKEIGDAKNVRIVDVIAWKSDVGEAAAGTTGAPTEQRIPDRSLVQGPGGGRATDEEIEAGTFQVSSTVNGAAWTLVPDVEPADIVLVGN
jgi:hypothetical protein